MAMAKSSDAAVLVGFPLVTIVQLVLPLLGLALHFWTVILVVKLGGSLGAVIAALIFPVFAEIAVGFVFWSTIGLSSPYCLALLSYVGLWIMSWIGFLLLAKSEI